MPNPDAEKIKCKKCGNNTFYVWLPSGDEVYCDKCGYRLGTINTEW